MVRFLSLIFVVSTLLSSRVIGSEHAATTVQDAAINAYADGYAPPPASRRSSMRSQQQFPSSYYSGMAVNDGYANPTTAGDNIIADQFPVNDGQCANGQCGDCACCDCCEPCWPRWYVQVEALFLWRDNTVGVQPVVLSSQTNSTVYDTRSADFDTGIGPRTLIGLRTSECTAWECQYFSALDMMGGASINSGGLFAAEQFQQLWGLFDAASIDYTSELHNVEVNYCRNWNGLSLLGGFRFVRLSENYVLNAFQPTDVNAYDVHTENNLFGGQLGARWRECCGRFYWEFTGKAGVFGNDANQSQFLTAGGGSQIQRDFISYDNCVAFVGDLNLSVGFRLNKVWAARCGYNVLWVDQVALAADQLNFNIGPGAGREISTSGDVFLHGINVGLEGRW